MGLLTDRVSRIGLALGLSVGLVTGAQAVAPDFMDKLQAEARPAADKVRDSVRRPAQVMAELGIQEGWTVVDVAAGGGWYTEVLSAAVGASGTVYSQAGPRVLNNEQAKAAAEAKAVRLGNVEVVFDNVSDMQPGIADAALTALNLHDALNFRGEDGAKSMLMDMYNVLKPGGVAAIIDHEGDAGMDNGNLHRMPVADAKRLAEAVGFEVVKESMVLHSYADDHSLPTRDPSLARNTDRFLLIVRKP